jgi:hypothetical protein
MVASKKLLASIVEKEEEIIFWKLLTKVVEVI